MSTKTKLTMNILFTGDHWTVVHQHETCHRRLILVVVPLLRIYPSTYKRNSRVHELCTAWNACTTWLDWTFDASRWPWRCFSCLGRTRTLDFCAFLKLSRVYSFCCAIGSRDDRCFVWWHLQNKLATCSPLWLRWISVISVAEMKQDLRMQGVVIINSQKSRSTPASLNSAVSCGFPELRSRKTNDSEFSFTLAHSLQIATLTQVWADKWHIFLDVWNVCLQNGR